MFAALRICRVLTGQNLVPQHFSISHYRSEGTSEIRGLLKNVGLVIGRAKFNVFAVRAEELIEDRSELIAVVGPLLKARQGRPDRRAYATDWLRLRDARPAIEGD